MRSTEIAEARVREAPASSRRFFDEMREPDGTVRPAYADFAELLDDLSIESLVTKQAAAEELFRRLGITFAVYAEGGSTERLIPFDLIPRILGGAEWELVQRGCIQRVKAINIFLYDIYHDHEIIKAGLVPPEFVLLNSAYRPEMHGVEPPNRVYAHIAGVDLVRTGERDFFVLEDNVRTPSGVSYVLENREIMMRLFPDAFAGQSIMPVGNYPERLLENLRAVAPSDDDAPVVVLLTPGRYNSAYFEHVFLAEQMGIELVEGGDLFVRDGYVWMRTTEGPVKVDVIYRRVDDDFMDPLAFNPQSALGIPGLLSAVRSGRVALAHRRHHGGARARAHGGALVGLGRFRTRLPGAAGAAAHEGTEYRRLAFGCKLEAMSEAEALFQVLRKSADASAVNAIEQLVRDGRDRELCRINALAFAAKVGLGEERAISAFLHAARIGLFDLSWNVLCPGCGGVLEAGATLKTVDRSEYSCALCAAGYEPTLDEMVEVTFTVNPRVRRIAAHSPHELSPVEYFRQIFESSGVDLPGDSLEQVIDELTLEQIELPAGERALLSLQLPTEFVIVFEPVTHAAHFIDVKGEPTRERQTLSMVFNKVRAPTGTTEMRPGPLRLALENRTDLRVLPGVWVAGDKLHDLLGRRRPFLTAKRLLTNQTFRDIYRTDTLDVDQRLKITSLTFLFTDLKGSTELYERVGDLVAFDLVKAHFRVLNEIVAAEAGAVVKTIGDAVMATFPTPDRAVAAALRMREAMRRLNDERSREDLLLKIGIHEGPCLAVVLNDHQDYFGQTVNLAARVQGLATSRSIFATSPVVGYPQTSILLRESGLSAVRQQRALRGLADEVEVYEIP